MLIPLLFMGDIVGRLFREFAVTLSVTILVSAVVSLTLTPMMCSKLLKHTPEAAAGPLLSRFGARFRIDHRVLRTHAEVRAALSDHDAAGRGRHAGADRLSVLRSFPKGFFPIQDTGVIQGISEAAQTVSFPEMSRLQQQLALVILKDPAVESLSSFIGIDGTNTTLNSGRIQINLKPLDDRNISASDVIRRLQPQLDQVSGITLFMQPVQDLTVEDRVSRTQFQYTLEDPNADELNQYAPRMIAALQKDAGIARCGQRSADRRSSGAAGLRSRDGVAARHHGLRPSTRRSTTPMASAKSRPCSRS